MHKHGKSMIRILFLLTVTLIAGLMVQSIAQAVVDVTKPVVTSVTPVDGSTIYTNGTSTIYYQSGNATPLTIKADYTDETGGSGVDPASVMVHLDGMNMLDNCPVQTASHVECIATAADLYPGTHPLDIYVADLAGNLTMNRTWVTVVVDNVAPTYANLMPAGGSTILTSQLNSATINDMSALRFDYDILDAAPSSGVTPMSHVNESVPPGVVGGMISNTSCVKTPDAVNTTHYSCQVNRAKLLHLGDNTLSVLLKDRVGNLSSDYSNAATLKHYMVVDDIAPTVGITAANETTISATYSDPAPTGALSTSLTSGINPVTAIVNVDGTTIMTGCSANATGVSCSTPSGLAGGTHTVEVIVKDNAGNEGMATGTLSICTPVKPTLVLNAGVPSWDSYAAYLARDLSVDWTIHNTGSVDASSVTLTSFSNTNGVTIIGSPTASYGSIAAGASATQRLHYNVNNATGFSWHTVNTGTAVDATCGTSPTYTYPV